MVRPKFALMTLLAGCLVGQPLIAQAGCGCSKLPPELAAVRPNVTFTGQDVTLFHAALQAGQSYTVTFTSGMTGASATVEADAVVRRDFADSTEKPQLVVPLPALPLGPTSIRLADETGTLTTLADDILTVAPPPLVLSAQEGKYNYNNYQAAVSRAGADVRTHILTAHSS